MLKKGNGANYVFLTSKMFQNMQTAWKRFLTL